MDANSFVKAEMAKMNKNSGKDPQKMGGVYKEVSSAMVNDGELQESITKKLAGGMGIPVR